MANLTANNLSVSGSDEDVSDNTTAPSSASASTHDISRASYHIRDLSVFSERLEQAAAKAFPNRGRSRYVDVISLLLYWEKDDLNVKSEVDELKRVFTQLYGFLVEVYTIPSSNPHRALMAEILDFVKNYNNSDYLVIVYYGGHGSINHSRQSTWMCNRKPDPPSVKWSAIQTNFEGCACDVLFLIDCCAAAGAVPDSGSGVIKTIAACGFETWAPAPGPYSFTNALIEVLEDWKAKPSFSVAMLHSEILSVIKHDRPERRRENDRKVETRKTPIHIHTSKDPKSKSIEISVLSFPAPAGLRSTNATGSTTISNPSIPPRTGIFDLSQLHSKLPSNNFKVPHVLLSVASEEDQSLDLNSWVRWIGDNPALAKYVLVEGVFRSHSTMLLLSLPVPVWDLLQDDLAVSFIAYVESSNILNTAIEQSNVQIQELIYSLKTAQNRVAILESANETSQQRLKTERERAENEYLNLHKTYIKQTLAKKSLEGRLLALEDAAERETTWQQKKAIPTKTTMQPKSWVPTGAKSETAMPDAFDRSLSGGLSGGPSAPIRPTQEPPMRRYDQPGFIQGTAANESLLVVKPSRPPSGYGERATERTEKQKGKLEWEKLENERISRA